KSWPEAFPFHKYGEIIVSAVARETKNASNQARWEFSARSAGFVVSGETVMQDSRDSGLGAAHAPSGSLDVSVCHSVLVFVDDAFFHNEDDVLRLPDIFDRVAGYSHNVGGFSGFQRADLVG